MRQVIGLVIGIVLLALPLSSSAREIVVVRDATIHATAPGQDSASMQFAISSRRNMDVLSASSPVAGAAEIHQMTQENGMMKMQVVNSIHVGAGRTVNLVYSGYHIMLLKLKRPLKEGERVPFSLLVEYPDKGREQVNGMATVKALADVQGKVEAKPDMPDMPEM